MMTVKRSSKTLSSRLIRKTQGQRTSFRHPAPMSYPFQDVAKLDFWSLHYKIGLLILHDQNVQTPLSRLCQAAAVAAFKRRAFCRITQLSDAFSALR